MKQFLVVLALLFLCACSSHEINEVEENRYDPANSARIRVFGNNAHNVMLYPGQDCNETTKSGEVNASSSLWGMFKSIGNGNDILSIGMPESAHTRNLKYGEGYKEFVLPGNQPTVVDGVLAAPGVSCNPPSRVFTPVPGKSYEMFIRIESGQCSVEIGEVQFDGAVMPVDADICRLVPSKKPAS